jgi:hypothetical protein
MMTSALRRVFFSSASSRLAWLDGNHVHRYIAAIATTPNLTAIATYLDDVGVHPHPTLNSERRNR